MSLVLRQLLPAQQVQIICRVGQGGFGYDDLPVQVEKERYEVIAEFDLADAGFSW